MNTFFLNKLDIYFELSLIVKINLKIALYNYIKEVTAQFTFNLIINFPSLVIKIILFNL